MVQSEQPGTRGGADEPLPGEPSRLARRGGIAEPVSHVLASFTRTGGFYARTWADFLDGDSGELPVARPTLGLATHAFVDEVLLTGFRLLKSPADPSMSQRINREVAAALEFYGQNGWLDNPEGLFAEPPPLSDVSLRPANSRGGSYERLSFDSGYEPCAGEPGRERWLSYRANARAYAMVLRHRGPRPWVVCVHGAEMGRPAIDLMAFRAWHLHRDLGLNVMLPVLALHGPRKRDLPKGAMFPGEDILDEVHGAVQSVWDIRRLLSWIRAQQPDAMIALNGVSLGGYVSSMVASLDDDLACAILGVPVADLVDLVGRHTGLRSDDPLQQTLALAAPLGAMISPFALTPRVPMQGRFIYAGIADRLVHPRDQVNRLWEHWGKPEIHWYPGGHTGFFRSQPVQRFIDDALVQAGLVDPTRVRRRR